MSILVFILTLCVMVMVHEYGHFIVARFFNVAISVFSIGFGPACFRRMSLKSKFEFRLCPILLGGYVKFAEDQKAYPGQILFENLGLIKKILVLIAGPLANIFLAFAALVIFFKLDSYTLLPYVGKISSGSIAQELGFQSQQKILKINAIPVFSWEDVLGVVNQGPASLAFLVEDKSGHPFIAKLKAHRLNLNGKNFFEQMGFTPLLPKIPAIVSTVMVHSPAEKAGLIRGDKILSINGYQIRYMHELSDFVSKHPGARVSIGFLRQDDLHKVEVQLNSVDKGGQAYGWFGVYSSDFKAYPQWFHYLHLSWRQAFTKALAGICAFCKIHIGAWLHIKDQFSSLSGPLGMAKAAEHAWTIGIRAYLFFVVWINIGLAIINLLPLPILDGGQCVVAILRKFFPRLMSPERQNRMAIWSIIFIFVLFVFGLFNDLSY